MNADCKQRNRPASRQLQDKVGGVTPADLSLDRRDALPLQQLVSTATVGCREYAMKNIADRLMWIRQRIRDRIQPGEPNAHGAARSREVAWFNNQIPELDQISGNRSRKTGTFATLARASC
jgi:hypothetical protein